MIYQRFSKWSAIRTAIGAPPGFAAANIIANSGELRRLQNHLVVGATLAKAVFSLPTLSCTAALLPKHRFPVASSRAHCQVPVNNFLLVFPDHFGVLRVARHERHLPGPIAVQLSPFWTAENPVQEWCVFLVRLTMYRQHPAQRREREQHP